MQNYTLANEFTDQVAEESLLAALTRQPELYLELLDILPAGAFAVESETWERVRKAIEGQQQPEIPNDWQPAADPKATARQLADLHQRRLMAEFVERLASLLCDQTTPPAVIAGLLEKEAIRVRSATEETAPARPLWASDWAQQVLREAAKREGCRKKTGKAVMGLPTGIGSLDKLLNGLSTGLYLLAGPPGVGKTTLALHIAAAAAGGSAVVVFVTFENSPTNLTLKAIAGRVQIDTQDVERGFADLERLQTAAIEWEPVGRRLALIEGTSRLSLTELRGKARQAMYHHRAERCLVVVDYLQLWAKQAVDLRALSTVRERVEALGAGLKELAACLQSPVLALASQNRAQGNYGSARGGSANLDSLKESGDLEYAADAVLFLTNSPESSAIPPARPLTLTVAKNRYDEVGIVELIFRPDHGTVREEVQG